MIYIGQELPTRLAPTTAPADYPPPTIAPRPDAPLPEPLPPDEDPQNNGVCIQTGWPWWAWLLVGAAGATAIGLTIWVVRR